MIKNIQLNGFIQEVALLMYKSEKRKHRLKKNLFGNIGFFFHVSLFFICTYKLLQIFQNEVYFELRGFFQICFSRKAKSNLHKNTPFYKNKFIRTTKLIFVRNNNKLERFEAEKFKKQKFEMTMIYISFKNLFSSERPEHCQSHLL